MSDAENNAAVAADEPMDISQEPVTSNGDHEENENVETDDQGAGDLPEKTTKKDIRIAESAAPVSLSGEGEKEENSKADDQIDSSQSKKKKKVEEKKPKEVKKSKEEKQKEEKEAEPTEEDSNEEGDEEEEEEVKVALLEQSPIIESGQKRQRKKVERMEYKSTETEKPKLEIEEGKGSKLGDIPRVEFLIGRTRADDLKPLHKLLYGKVLPTSNKIKKNIREFSGFVFDKDSSEYEKKKTVLTKMTMSSIKSLCIIVDVERSGQKDVVVTRLLDFLLEPSSSGKALQKKRKRSSSKKKKSKSKKAAGSKDKKKKSEKSKSKDKVEEESGKEEDEASESDDEEEIEKDEASEEGDEDLESDAESLEEKEENDEGDSDYEEAPKKKRARKESPKKAATPKQKKETKKSPQKEAKKTPKPKKEKKKATPKKVDKKPAKRRIVESSDDDSSDDEPLIAKKKPPTDEELRDVIKKILDTANLEEVTMKTVCRQVYDKYPDFDLTSRKDFIKTTVKQIIR